MLTTTDNKTPYSSLTLKERMLYPFPNNRLREVRESCGLTQTALAQRIGVHQKMISYWERGQRKPNCAQWVGLASFFGVSVCFLLGVPETTESVDVDHLALPNENTTK